MILPTSSTRATAALCALLALGTGISAAPTTERNSTCLPVVDLGYELHRALWYNNETDVYKFQNIRYAQEPSGNLRFRAPQPPKTDRSVIQTGSEVRICPQGQPAWITRAFIPMGKYSTPGVPFTLEGWYADLLNGTAPPGDVNANASEDCLLLDVHVPKKVLQGAATGKADVPVLVWIHGGGAVFGSKDGSGRTVFDPAGIMAQGREVYGEEFIFVGLNYRLGAFGFLSGSEVKSNGNANAGLLDQRFALDWVQKYIHLFGGSKDHVTVLGESGGAGSALNHMATNGGNGPTPFKQLIAQSPAGGSYLPDEEDTFNEFMTYLNVASLEEARSLDSKTIIQGNFAQIANAPETTFLYGPKVDGSYITEPLISSIRKGAIDQSVKMLVGHNMLEGGFTFDPTVKTDEEFRAWLASSIWGIGEENMDYLMDTVYPSIFDGSLGYVDQGTRGMAVWAEAVFDCTYLLAGQLNSKDTYSYEFGVPPSFHTQDLSYTFGSDVQPATYSGAQDHLQLAIASFLLKGTPLLEPGQAFPVIGDHNTIVNITSDGRATPVPNRVNQTRCDWWANLA